MAGGGPAPCHACAVGNVTLPTPVFVAGGALSLLAGYLIGVVAGPDTPDRTTGTVVSFDPQHNRLCLGGDGVTGLHGVDGQGHLCGIWRRTSASTTPGLGNQFRFVSVSDPDTPPDASGNRTVIYGNVVG